MCLSRSIHLTSAFWKSSPCNCPGHISKRCGMVMSQGGQGTGLVEKWASSLFAAWVSNMAGSRTANISPVLQPTVALCFSHTQLLAYTDAWMHKVTFAPPGFLRLVRVMLPGGTCCAHTTENRSSQLQNSLGLLSMGYIKQEHGWYLVLLRLCNQILCY